MSEGASVSQLLREAAALVYVRDLEAPELASDDAHHMSAVLRLRPGEIVVASDGAGSYRRCRIAGGRRLTTITLTSDTKMSTATRMAPELTVGFSLAKGDRTDWAVAKLSELGADRIVPLICERTAVRWNPQTAAHQHARLCRIAREACMQSRRLWLAEVLEVLPMAEAVASLRLGGTGVALAEPGGAIPSLATPVVLVGPEGGFSPRERSMGLPEIRLGETILRIETAAIAAGVILAGLRAGLLGQDSAREHAQ